MRRRESSPRPLLALPGLIPSLACWRESTRSQPQGRVSNLHSYGNPTSFSPGHATGYGASGWSSPTDCAGEGARPTCSDRFPDNRGNTPDARDGQSPLHDHVYRWSVPACARRVSGNTEWKRQPCGWWRSLLRLEQLHAKRGYHQQPRPKAGEATSHTSALRR